MAEGSHTFSARLSDALGNRSSAVSARFTIDTTPPRIVSVTPADGSVLASPQVTIRGTVDDASATVVLEGVGQATTTGTTGTQSSFSVPATLAPGLNRLVLSAIDRATNSSDTTLHLTYASVSVNVGIESPANGAVIAGSSVTVSGTFEGPANTGITVNGAIAGKFGNRFYAEVPLAVGSNTINVVASAPQGVVTQSSLTVTRSGEMPVALTLVRSQGVAPFTASFSMANLTGKRITDIALDKEGDGVVDARTADATAELAITYPVAGIHQARAVVTFDDATQVVAAATVVVVDPAGVDSELRAIWQQFTAALAADDRAAALAHFNQPSRQRYDPILSTLSLFLSGIAASFSPVGRVSLSDDIGEYAVVRPFEGRNRVYLIYFLRDADGVWRLDSM